MAIDEIHISMTDRSNAAVAAGLYALADFLVAHPELPDGAITTPTVTLHLDLGETFDRQAAALADVARIAGGWQKEASHVYQHIYRDFAGHVRLDVVADRDVVCTRKQVGTETKFVPDPSVPKVPVEVPVYEYDCAPLLAS